LLNYRLPVLASPADEFKASNVSRFAYTLP